MKRSIIAWSLCLPLVAGTVSQAAPKAAKPALLDVIEVSTDDGGRGGAHGGGGSSWTLRSNDTMDHSESVTAFDSVAMGAEGVNHVNGAMEPGSFARMLGYLQWTRLLDIKEPKSSEEDGPQGGVTISLVRGGKKKSVRLSDSGVAISTTLTLVQSLAQRIDWKNDKGLSLNTGLFVQFVLDAEGLPESARVEFPSAVVQDATGKEVGHPSVHSPTLTDTVVLAPGTYHVIPKTAPPPEGFVWRAMPATAVVRAGKMTTVKIALQKIPATP